MGALTAAETRELRSTLLLQRLPGVGDLGVARLVARFGSADAAWRASAGAFAGVAGDEAARRRSDPERGPRVDEALAWCAAHGATVMHRGFGRYPSQLASVENPPAVLFLLGDPALLERETVTVVGSRKATEYGRRVAREVAQVAVRHGAVVASGLALGIDGEAHRAALDAAGSTVAVLGCGLAHPYPRSHTRLFRRIAREGLVVSEFLPTELPLGHHFLRRNRTLAALAKVVVVVEAAERSGALDTAGHALDLGRSLLSVPGSIYAPMSRGTNALLDRAAPLVTPQTVVEHLAAGAQEVLTLFPDAPPEDVGPAALRVWDALADTPRHVDELARAARLASAEALVALSLLELGGWARQEAGARFIRSRSA